MTDTPVALKGGRQGETQRPNFGKKPASNFYFLKFFDLTFLKILNLVVRSESGEFWGPRYCTLFLANFDPKNPEWCRPKKSCQGKWGQILP